MDVCYVCMYVWECNTVTHPRGRRKGHCYDLSTGTVLDGGIEAEENHFRECGRIQDRPVRVKQLTHQEGYTRSDGQAHHPCECYTALWRSR